MTKLLLAITFAGILTQTALAQSTRPVLRSSSTATTPPAPTKNDDAAGPEISEDNVVRVSTSLITIPAEVMDRSGRFAGNLTKEDFHLYENGVEQEVTYFAPVQEPFTVALLLDVSGSTQAQLQSIRTAANAFISRLRPNDRLLIVSFDGKINVMTEAVTTAELRRKKLRLDATNDGTVLYDAVGFVLNQRLATIPGRKAIVLLTDGVDGSSKHFNLRQNLRDAEEADVIIYPVQYNTLPQLPERLSQIADNRVREKVRNKLTKDYSVAAVYLQNLADKTGGRLYSTDNLADLPFAFTKITEELGRKYSLGYYPKSEARPGEKRVVKVKVNSPNLVVRAKDGYVAGAVAANVR